MDRSRWNWIRPFPWGRPVDFWLVHEQYIKGFIDEFKLKPVFRERVRTEQISRERVIDIGDLVDQRGGKRTPHLHYRGEMYLLDTDQWKQFSNTIIKEFSKKLAAANTVNFEQFMELADTMNTMP